MVNYCVSEDPFLLEYHQALVHLFDKFFY